MYCGCVKWIIKTSAGISFDECIKRIEKNYFHNGKSGVPYTSVANAQLALALVLELSTVYGTVYVCVWSIRTVSDESKR